MAKTRHLFIGDTEISRWMSLGDFMQSLGPLIDSLSSLAVYEGTAARVSLDQRLMRAVVAYIGQVDNGGHWQFYENSTGLLWREAVNGFNKFGLPELAQIVEESAGRMGGPLSDWEERIVQLGRIEPDFSDLDDRLYALEEKLNLDERLMEYFRSNPSQFYLDVMIDE